MTQRLGTRVVNRAAEQLAARFNSERIAAAVAAALHGSELAALREPLARAHDRTTEVLTITHCRRCRPATEFSAEARAMFAKTPSLDDIVDRAHALLLAAVGRRLTAPIKT